MAAAGPALAAGPQVRFDAPSTLACRDVTSAEFALAHPAEKLVEVRFRVSALLTAGRPEEVDEVLVSLASPERRLRVVDFLPQTELFTEVVGDIEVVKTDESARSLEAGIAGGASLKYGPAQAEISPSLRSGSSQRDSLKESYKKLPPRELLLAAGTTHGGHGVFFKLKQSPHDTLEGAREFVCRFAVPCDWRADWAVLSCQARGWSNRYLVRQLEECGQARLFVPLYLEGDLAAQEAAAQFAQAETARLAGGASPGSRPRSAAHNESTGEVSSAAPLGFPALFRLCARPFDGAWSQRDTSPAGPTWQESLDTLAALSGSRPGVR